MVGLSLDKLGCDGEMRRKRARTSSGATGSMALENSRSSEAELSA